MSKKGGSSSVSPAYVSCFSFPSAVAAVASWLGGGWGLWDWRWTGVVARRQQGCWAGASIADARSCTDFWRQNPNCSWLDSDSLASLLSLIYMCPVWARGYRLTRKAKCNDFFGYLSIGVILVRELGIIWGDGEHHAGCPHWRTLQPNSYSNDMPQHFPLYKGGPVWQSLASTSGTPTWRAGPTV